MTLYNTRLPVGNIVPLVFREGAPLLELIHTMAKYIHEQLHPSLSKVIDDLVADVESQMDEHHAQYVAGVEEFRRIHDAFMADVNARLIALNDQAVTNLVEDETSRLGSVLRDIFTTNTDFQDYQQETTTKINTVIDSVETVDNRVDAVNTVLDGRLSEQQLQHRYDTRTRVNTTVMDGDTGHDRLVNAVATGEPVQLDETVDYGGNITGFWDTNVYGTGAIVLPNGDTFTPDPTPEPGELIINTIYLNAATGSPDHDGLTPATPMDSLETVYQRVLRRLTAQQAAGARWIIQLSGDFTEGVTMRDIPDFPHGLVFDGGDSSLTTIRRTEDSEKRIGIWVEPGITQMEVYNIHFRGWAVGFNGYGVLMKLGGRIAVGHCEFTGCDIATAAVQNVQFSFTDNTYHPTNRTAISTQYNSTGQANRNILTGGPNDINGIRISRGVNAHVDDNEIYGYTRGLYVDMASRAAVDRNRFGENRVAVTVSSASEWSNNDNTFLPSNDDHFQHHGAGREVGMHSEGAWTGNDFRIAATQTNSALGMFQSHPSVSSRTILYSGGAAGQIPTRWFTNYGKRIHVMLHGSIQTTLTSTAYIEIGSTLTDASGWSQWLNIPIPSGTSGAFRVEAFIYAQNSTSQRSVGSVMFNNGSRVTASSTSTSMGSERRMRAYFNPGSNNAISLITYNMETFFIG